MYHVDIGLDSVNKAKKTNTNPACTDHKRLHNPVITKRQKS